MHDLIAGITQWQNISISRILTLMSCYLQPVSHSRKFKFHSLNNIIPKLSMDINTKKKGIRNIKQQKQDVHKFSYVHCVMMLSLWKTKWLVIGWLMNWKGYIRRWSWPNPGTVLAFMEVPRKTTVRVVSVTLYSKQTPHDYKPRAWLLYQPMQLYLLWDTGRDWYFCVGYNVSYEGEEGLDVTTKFNQNSGNYR